MPVPTRLFRSFARRSRLTASSIPMPFAAMTCSTYPSSSICGSTTRCGLPINATTSTASRISGTRPSVISGAIPASPSTTSTSSSKSANGASTTAPSQICRQPSHDGGSSNPSNPIYVSPFIFFSMPDQPISRDFLYFYDGLIEIFTVWPAPEQGITGNYQGKLGAGYPGTPAESIPLTNNEKERTDHRDVQCPSYDRSGDAVESTQQRTRGDGSGLGSPLQN